MPDESNSIQSPPPSGDSSKANNYLDKIIQLINQDKLEVFHTDLKKFELESIQDHYFINLDNYQIEVSHSKHPSTNKDFYIILFNNLKQTQDGCSEKIILSYLHLEEDQFKGFKQAADLHIEKKHKEEEERRFKLAMAPIDQQLDQLLTSPKKPYEEATTQTALDPDNEIPSSLENHIPDQDMFGTKEENPFMKSAADDFTQTQHTNPQDINSDQAANLSL